MAVRTITSCLSVEHDFDFVQILKSILKISRAIHYIIFRFVPRQRWLHNIEHGAVVMLYDPCVLDSEVNKLKNIVRNCIKKHIITPTTFLSQERVKHFLFIFKISN